MKGRLFIHFVPEGSDADAEARLNLESFHDGIQRTEVITPGKNLSIEIAARTALAITLHPRGTTQAQAAIGKAEKVQP